MTADLFGVEHAERRAIDDYQQNGRGSDEWLTPPELISALGTFDLDPCSPGARRPWDTAARHYAIEDDGLRQEWAGRVWLNPPYANAAKWMHRLAEHGAGTALIFARTETRLWFDHVWPRAAGLLFLRGRIKFCYVNGKPASTAGAPSVLVAYGDADAAVLASEPLPGRYVPLTATAADLTTAQAAAWERGRADGHRERRPVNAFGDTESAINPYLINDSERTS